MDSTVSLRALPLLAAAALAFITTAFAAEPSPFEHPDRISYDSHCLQIEGKDTLIYSGSFHYFRCPKELWRDRFQKIKDAGFNAVETYVPWNWHERQAPKSPEDFSKITGLDDLDDWITMAEQFGLYVIIRPGPYICSEWSGGGFPQWLVALKKPADWPAGKSWLQTDDSEFLAWSRHWYQAVCPIIAKHQITRKQPGQPGVILFQIENEYQRLNWLPHDMKKRYLEALATDAREGGIDVPIFTCYTQESRNVPDGPLHGVFDMMNYYPKWDVEKQLGDRTSKQRKEQPYAPAMSAELQGGWYSEVGGKLSEDQDGVAPVQTQNLTLYELQLGYSLINYYMLFGGTNFDDWASRETTTTYDFDAAIREHGGVGEKYQRVWGIGHMLRDYGTQLARSDASEIDVTTSDSAVEVAERRSPDGSRFFFVRTEDRSGPHNGHAQVKEKDGTEFSFDFQLEPFGSMVLRLAPGATDPSSGEWLPKRGPDIQRPTDLPSPVAITDADRFAELLPTDWKSLPPGAILEKQGIFDRHFIYYRVTPPSGQPFTVARLGDKVVNGTKADGVLAMANGKLLPPSSEDKDGVTFQMPADATETVLLYENRGLQQHTKPVLEEHWDIGTPSVKSGGQDLPLQYEAGERERGLSFSDPKAGAIAGSSRMVIGKDTPDSSEALLTWYRINFGLPVPKPGIWVPWHFHLLANGNGFIYLNGNCIGRYWEAGPQHDFFLPECWLNFGPGKTNAIALDLRPLENGVSVQEAAIAPDTAFAEMR